MSDVTLSEPRSCPACGHEVEKRSLVFCPSCGVNMPKYAADHDARARSKFYTDEEGNRLKKCPYCAEEVKAEAIVCKHCGRDLEPARVRQEVDQRKPPKKWYRQSWFLILSFLFLTPLWTLIVLDDPDQTTGVKVLAVIFLLVYLGLICQVFGGLPA